MPADTNNITTAQFIVDGHKVFLRLVVPAKQDVQNVLTALFIIHIEEKEIVEGVMIHCITFHNTKM